MRLADRGVLKQGMWADVVVFDPDTIRDLATFEKPNQLSVGMEYVLVNGVPVIDDGKMTGALPGQGPARPRLRAVTTAPSDTKPGREQRPSSPWGASSQLGGFSPGKAATAPPPASPRPTGRDHCRCHPERAQRVEGPALLSFVILSGACFGPLDGSPWGKRSEGSAAVSSAVILSEPSESKDLHCSFALSS